MKKFGIIGTASFVTKKYLNCIKKMKGELVAAYDKHDNVGFIDKHYTKADFFKNEDQFFSFIKKRKLNYIIICSPSYLHYKHILKSLKCGVNIIVEKPSVLSFKNLKKINFYEKNTI